MRILSFFSASLALNLLFVAALAAQEAPAPKGASPTAAPPATPPPTAEASPPPTGAPAPESRPPPEQQKKTYRNSFSFKQRYMIAAGGSVLFFIEDKSIYSDPSPVLPALHLKFAAQFFEFRFFSAAFGVSLDIYSTHYKWGPPERPRPLPAAIENRDARVFGIPLGLILDFRFQLLRRLAIDAGFGILGDCRIVLLAEDIDESEIEEVSALRDKIKDALWNNLSWLFIQMEFGVDVTINEKTFVWVGGRMAVPLAAYQKFPDDSALYGYRFGIGIKIIYKF